MQQALPSTFSACGNVSGSSDTRAWPRRLTFVGHTSRDGDARVMWIADGACSALTSTLLIVKGYLHPETNTTGLAVLQFPARCGSSLPKRKQIPTILFQVPLPFVSSEMYIKSFGFKV